MPEARMSGRFMECRIVHAETAVLAGVAEGGGVMDWLTVPCRLAGSGRDVVLGWGTGGIGKLRVRYSS